MGYRPRFFDVRSSSLPSAIGLCATDITSLLSVVNECEERLINDKMSPEDGWYGSEARIAFNVSRTEPSIVTPSNIARIMAMDVCKYPVRINNGWYEFLEFGPGFQPKGCTNANGSAVHPNCQGPAMAFERETVTTFAPLLGPSYIRAYVADPADVGRTALANTSGSGERITFSSPFTDTANIFSADVAVQKQKTFGEVQFFQVDAATGQESPLLVMSPSETTASFRKYFLNGLPDRCCNANVPHGTNSGTLQVIGLCKLDFVPVTCDSDYLNLQSVPALIDAAQWLRLSRMDVPGAQQLAEAKHGSALSLLFGKLQHYLGNDRPAIRRSLFGSNPMRPSFR